MDSPIFDLVVAPLAAFALTVAGVPLAKRLARRYGIVAPPGPDSRHQRPTALFGGAAVVGAFLLVVATVVSTVLAVWAIRAEGRAEQRLVSEKAERERAVAAERERKRQLVKAKLAQARLGRVSRRIGQRFPVGLRKCRRPEAYDDDEPLQWRFHGVGSLAE